MKTIQFQNSFHNTTVSVRVQDENFRPGEQEESRVYLSKRQQRRVERELCGMKDCMCGGHQNYSPPLDGKWAWGGAEVVKN
ncbi:MAG: hypothetical protein DDT35_01276 [Firmicutes bacterium]|nr:hypothetical protein [Bacillota bacterium]